MSSFTKPLLVKVLDNGDNYELLEEFEYYRETTDTEVLKVPAGFITDFASVPQVFWSIIPPFGKYTKSAVLHDYLYDKTCIYTDIDKKAADGIFKESMQAVGVNKIVIWLLYYSVKWFAKRHFRK